MKFNIRNNNKGFIDMYVYDDNNTSNLIIRDIDYLIEKLYKNNNEFYFKGDYLEAIINDLNKQVFDILKRKDKNKEIKDFVFLTNYRVLIPIKIRRGKKNIIVSFRNVYKNLYFCNANPACKTRIDNNLYPYDSCCCFCTLSKKCNLVCNQRYSICFYKEKI